MTADAHSVIGIIFGACQCKDTFDCTSSIDAHGGIVLWLLIMLYMFKALGTVCDEYFVPSLEMISEKLELSNDVAGATFMAAGSSAPELFTSIVATFLIVNEGGVGAIIGSAIFNILVIVGATCVCAGQVLVIWWYPLIRDCCFYSLAIFELALFIGNDDQILWYEALAMFLSYVLYCYYMKHNEKIASLARGETKVDVEEGNSLENPEPPEAPPPGEGQVSPPVGSAEEDGGTGGTCEQGNPHHMAPHVLRSMKELRTQRTVDLNNQEGGHVLRSMKELKTQKTQELASQEHPAVGAVPEETAEEAQADDDKKEDNEETETGWRRYARDPLNVFWEFTMPTPENYWMLFTMSVLWIGFATYIMVDAVNRIGMILNVSPLVMGLIFLAAGTSVPDALGSIAVAQQGEGDMAVANALGSNVFDILLGLGVPWLLKLAMGNEVHMSSHNLMMWIIILAVILTLFLGALILNKWMLNKQMGAILMGMYFVHVTVALIRTFTGND